MVDEIDDDKVIYFSSIARILGSAILTFAIYFNLISKEEAFEYSIIDEIWQNEISGSDEDDLKRREIIKQEYLKLVDELMSDDE
ncbi:MAG: hypothetical protein BWY78_01311 [Alphaproteobacteria bacterium ADurb.Bin438]|nr:MAG: hypothetical protein BWY78_01311 [Alphaproteobacteria bacterium ADurb.Bin438]